MLIEKFIYCFLIFCGAIVMLVSIVKAKDIIQVIPFVPKRHRQHLSRYLNIHRSLMGFFLFGYLVVLTAFAFDIHLVSQLFVSVIFLLGAIFVLLGTFIQSRLLSEIQTTLQGILPICAKCKKIQIEDDQVKDSKSWKNIEVYISEKADVDLSHGLCPECFENEMEVLNKLHPGTQRSRRTVE